MSQFFADLDGTTKDSFSIGPHTTIGTRTDGGIEIPNGGSILAGPIQAYASDDYPNQMGGGIMILAGGPQAGMLGSDYGVKLLSRDTMMASYALRFPAAPPVAEEVQLMVAQGENLNFVPLATLAAGAVKVEKKLVPFSAAATTPWLTLPPGAEIWRLRIVVLQQFAATSGGAMPQFTLGVTGNLSRYLDLTLTDHTQPPFSSQTGTIIDYTPDEMAASEAPLVIGFTPNGATAGQAALYCEYMIPNV